MDNRKRKRDAQNAAGERPQKKIAASTTKVSLVPADDLLSTVIASTPGLNVPSNIEFKSYQKPSNGSRRPPELLLHSSQHPKIDYTATDVENLGVNSIQKHYIAIYDKDAHEMQLLEVRPMTVRATLRSEIEELREERERRLQQRVTMTAKRQALGLEFGTKKSKKAIADLTENAIIRNKAATGADGISPHDPVAAAILNDMAKTTKDMPSKKDHEALIDEAKARPKANLSAETPADVYSTETIVGKEMMAALNVKPWVDGVEGKKEAKIGVSRFAYNRFGRVAKSGDIRRLKVLRYLSLLVDFHSQIQMGGIKGAKRLKPREKVLKETSIPGNLWEELKRRFAANNEMTKWHIDNLITHIAAAALIVDEFTVDVHDLREDLKINNKEIKQYFHEIGCKVKAPSDTERLKMNITKAEAINHSLAILKLPLDFPKTKGFAGRR